MIDHLIRNTNLTRTTPGSKTRALMDGVSTKLGTMWRSFDLNVAQSFLHGAHGRFLDFIGDMMGIHRINEAPARLSAVDQIQRFYVSSGTFGSINGGADIVLTSGVTISTGVDGQGIIYFVPQQVILSAADSEAFVPLQSTGTGSQYHVGAEQLRYHNFSGYTNSADNSLKTTNDFEIAYAQDPESDTNYRYRISQAMTASEAGNLTALRMATLITPGVADLQIIKYANGIGTFDIIVKSVMPSVSDSLLQAVSANVEAKQSFGTKVYVRGPKETGFGLVGSIRPRRKLSAQEESQLLSSVTDNITEYVNNLDIAEGLYINELVERVMSTSNLIRDIGVPGKPFDELFIYIENDLGDNKIRGTLVTNYLPASDEKVLVENRYGGNTPILFRVVY